MAEDLSGKVAIITGGASGIGRAIVEAFVTAGSHVVIADIQDERGRDHVGQLGGAADYCHTDVSQADQMEALVARAVEAFGALDVMVNNAGVGGASHPRFLDDDLADFHKVMNVDLLGVMLGSKFAGKHMATHGGGAIINIASTAASFAGFGVMTYRAAKAGVLAVTKSLAIDFGEYGIRVNSISPGPTKTEITAMGAGNGVSPQTMDAMQNASMQAMMGMQPLKRMGQADDIAQAALFLASERAAQISGLDLVVAGGAAVGDPENRLEIMQAEIAKVMASAGGS